MKVGLFDNVKTIDSEEGNVRKYVFTSESAVAESVLYKYPDYKSRTVICCSTMSGCPVGCRFCGAGDYFARNLNACEIVEQVDRCIKDTGVNPADMGRLQIMFMSMGEPLLNGKSLQSALRILYEKHPNAALLISTIGPNINYTWLREMSVEIPTIGLQFSIHEPTNEKRNQLIPYEKKLTLEEIADEGTLWFNATGRKPFFNYCANTHNSSENDAERIFELFNPEVWNATVSVVCERNEGMPAKNEFQIKLACDFSSLLVEKGFDVRVFDPAGQDDIGGGCGQLWFVQDWMRNNPDKVKPSVGNGIPSVHTPIIAVG